MAKIISKRNGLLEVEIDGWEDLQSYITKFFIHYLGFIYRGQREADWHLETSLDRLLKLYLPEYRTGDKVDEILKQFKIAARGRRGPNPPILCNENDWWALGQHHGLATPLLDWTESPYAGVFFAFSEAEKPNSGYRSLWVLHEPTVQKKSDEIREASGITDRGRSPVIEFIRSDSNENMRLVNQAALFTRSPINTHLDAWVQRHFKGEEKKHPLIKLAIPEFARGQILIALTAMNIHHATLFPDLYGAAMKANMNVPILQYLFNYYKDKKSSD